MAFNFANATLPTLDAAFKASVNLGQALEDFHTGNPRPVASRNRFTDAQIEALLTKAKAAVDALATQTGLGS